MNPKNNFRKAEKIIFDMATMLFVGLLSFSAVAATVTYSPLFTTGWNLAGNSLSTAIDVKATFGAQAGVQTVWKWDAANTKWAFYSPALDTAGTLAGYAATKGYNVLSAINQGEGYWVNASAQVSLAQASGTGFSLVASNLVTGWNLVATGDDISPAIFTATVGNVTTQWAWDNANSAWYFYAPALAANNTLAGYITGKSYKDFGALTLGKGLGFWVNYVGAGGGGGTGGHTTGGTTIPSAPTGVTAAAINATQINLTWTAVTGAQAYYVYRATTACLPVASMTNVTSGSALVGPSTVATTLNDTYTLAAGTIYYYKVAALNSIGASVASTEVNATTSAAAGGTASFSPASGAAGTTVTIPGLDASKNAIRFGTVCVSPTYTNFNYRVAPLTATATVQIPNGLAAGNTNLIVSNTDGSIATTLGTFNVTTAGATGIWSNACYLNARREQGHTSTLLANGKVLVAGGQASGAKLDSAELYDPSTGLWTNTGKLTALRTNHTATLLNNGKVLVVSTPWSALGIAGTVTTAELYDPATGVWTATGALNKTHGLHATTLLSNGNVLVIGGLSPVLNTATSTYVATDAEIYDPATGAWTVTGSLNHNRFGGQTTTLLPNGKVLVVGGNSSAIAELYDPATGLWAVTGNLNGMRGNPTATLLSNGKVLVTGDSTVQSGAVLAAGPYAELYDPTTGLWTVTGAPNTSRLRAAATLLNNGKVLLTGGSPNGGATAASELYDPATGLWTTTTSLTYRRELHTATKLSNGGVLVVGGFNGNGSDPELYIP